jgi:hypothetical protein
MTRSSLILMASALAAATALSVPAHADEGLLIWTPTKNSDTAYNARLGTRVPGWANASAGVDVGVASAVKGGRVETPVRFWGRVTANELQTPAYRLRRDIDVRMNALTGGAAAEVSTSNKRIVSGSLDLELRRTVGLSYDGITQQWSGLNVNQAVRLSTPAYGTALVVRAGAISDFKRVGAGMAIEQSLTKSISVTGSLDRAVGSELSAGIHARYSLTW